MVTVNNHTKYNLSFYKQILDDLTNGSLKIIVGTHALIEDNVSFSSLGLVVVDEQHRFGVRQRNQLLKRLYNYQLPIHLSV